MIKVRRSNSNTSLEQAKKNKDSINSMSDSHSQRGQNNPNTADRGDDDQSLHSLNQSQKSIPNVKMTIAAQKKLVMLFKDTGVKWNTIKEQFKDICPEGVKLTVSRLMKRALSGLNRINESPFSNREISKLSSDYAFKIFRSLIARKVQKSDEDQVDLFEMIFNFMFKSAKEADKVYNANQKKINSYIVIRTMEINEMEMVRQTKKRKITKKKDLCAAAGKCRYVEEEENKKNNNVVKMIGSCEKVRTIYKILKERKDNTFYESELKEFDAELKSASQVIKECVHQLLNQEVEKGIAYIYEDVIRRLKFCKEKLTTAQLKYLINSIEDLFAESDIEAN